MENRTQDASATTRLYLIMAPASARVGVPEE
jgi:hypothetical protein